ncbi:MAG: hypothetical protein V4617_15265 [Gemmatimonadota bacterium]
MSRNLRMVAMGAALAMVGSAGVPITQSPPDSVAPPKQKRSRSSGFRVAYASEERQAKRRRCRQLGLRSFKQLRKYRKRQTKLRMAAREVQS